MRFVDQDDFAAHVAAHLGAFTLNVDRACEIVICAFAGWLSPAEHELLVSELPSSLRVPANTSLALPLEEQLIELGLSVGHAREVIAAVCHVLGERLSDDLLARLRRALPPTIASFLDRPATDATSSVSRNARRYDTLAEGRPGSHAPISEASTAQPQQGSIAADNPHGDAKLSSAVGSTQEREHETLAEGHPAVHPIATARG